MGSSAEKLAIIDCGGTVFKVHVNVVKEGVRDFIFRRRILNIEIYTCII